MNKMIDLRKIKKMFADSSLGTRTQEDNIAELNQVISCIENTQISPLDTEKTKLNYQVIQNNIKGVGEKKFQSIVNRELSECKAQYLGVSREIDSWTFIHGHECSRCKLHPQYAES